MDGHRQVVEVVAPAAIVEVDQADGSVREEVVLLVDVGVNEAEDSAFPAKIVLDALYPLQHALHDVD